MQDLNLKEGNIIHVNFGCEDEQGLHMIRLDMEEIYHHTQDPIHIDEFDITSQEGMDELNAYLFSTYEGDSLMNVPKCGCDKDPLMGTFNLGIVCVKCNKEVKSGVETDIDNRLWLRANDRMYKFISPRVLALLINKTTVKNVCGIRYFADPRYRVPKEASAHHAKLKAILQDLGIQRGWRTFVDNLLPIMQKLIEYRILKIKYLRELQELYEHIERNIDITFTRYLPLPSNLVMIKEKTSIGTYGTTAISDVINGARSITELYEQGHLLDDDKYDSMLFSSMLNISEGYTFYSREELFKKPGLVRSGMISGRMDMTARAVITSINRPHDHREVEIPWAMGIRLLEKQLVKYLRREQKMSVTKALGFLRYHYYIYNETIDVALQTILSQMPEVPYSAYKLRGMPITFQRNPGLKLASQQKLYVTVVKTKPNDWTISFSGLVLNACNADQVLKCA